MGLNERHELIRRRYPRILTALRQCLIASEGEAVSIIRLHQDGYDCGPEVISHSGITPTEAIRWALKCYRPYARTLRAGG